jgi:Protein of unknown function (DUF1553)/Protein of unknown function (DUF1549)
LSFFEMLARDPHRSLLLAGCTWLILVGAALCGTAPEEPTVEKLGDAWHDARNPVVRRFGNERLDLWSLRPLSPGAVPSATWPNWERNPIDRFVASRLAAHKLSPAPAADRRTLARRVAFDLTGMPPTPEELQRFVDDRRADAYERWVDALLASPRYGEHQARLWLDVVRYSDSNGFDWDEFRPQAWRFRDYVIRSFNADKPYDRFLTEQLAGDELVTGPPQSRAEQEALIATGFLRLGPHDNAAPLFNEQDRSRAELMADVVETTGSAFLGLSLSCCRCHDHKYDPLLQADHYRLRAFFEPIAFADQLPLDLAPEQDRIREENAALEQKWTQIEQQRDALLAPTRQKLVDQKRQELPAEQQSLLERPEAELNEEQQAQRAELQKQITPSDQEIRDALAEETRDRLAELDKDIQELKRQQKKFTTGLLMTNSDEAVPVTHLLYQGDHRAPRDAVPPGFLSALDPNPAELPEPATPPGRGRRLALARWITSADNPLTARVFVNRLWQAHFGRGIVSTPNDFGLAGGRPTHPELLDWLAAEFMRGNWSVKNMHRLIVTSATYRQGGLPRMKGDAAAISRETGLRRELFGYQPARRLTAEQLRDSLLVASGLLTAKSDGPPIWPDLPEEILKANPAFLDDNELKVKGWYPSAAEEQTARTIFLVQKRTVRLPFLETFDLPENFFSCPQRSSSTVPPQALSLLNSPLAAQAAQAFAERVTREAAANPRQQVETAFRIALQRAPKADELAPCLQFLEQRTLAEFCRVVLNLNEFQYVD